jgi:hypothetical protein
VGTSRATIVEYDVVKEEENDGAGKETTQPIVVCTTVRHLILCCWHDFFHSPPFSKWIRGRV